MKHFTEAEDLALLDELLATPPSEAVHGKVQLVWEGIAERVSQTIKRPITHRFLQDR